MPRKVFVPAGALLLGLLLMTACGRAEPDPALIAKAVNATLTASAPRVQTTPQAPAADLAATVEALVTREAAGSAGNSTASLPASTRAPIQTAVQTSTLPSSTEVAPTPSAWLDYTNPAGAFTLRYPDTWKIASQLVNRVTFSFPPNGVANVDVLNTADASGGLRDAMTSADAIARYAMEDQAGRYVIGTVEKGVWPGQGPGYFAVLDVSDYGLAIQWLYVAMPRGEKHGVLAKVALVNGKVTQEQREMLAKILASVQPAGEATPTSTAEPAAAAPTPAPQAPAATVAPTSAPPTSTPVPQASPVSAAATAQPPAGPGVPQAATIDAVNLRAGPGTAYKVMAVTQPGQKYDVVGRNQDGTWYQICCVADQKLWVSAAVILITGDATSIPVVETPTPAPPVALTPTPGQ